MRKIAFYFLCLVALHVQALESFSFDWDDNIMTLVPEIVLIRNDTNEEIVVSTRVWATIRHQVGEGKTYRRKPEDPAQIDQNLIENFKKTLALDPKSWQGPVWKSFLRALETEEGAQNTTIITGRRNSREAYFKVMEILRDRGFVKHLLPLQNIYPVGNKALFPGNKDVSEVKAQVMEGILDRLNAEALNGEATHFWNFSDDDPENFRIAREFITNQKKQGRWPNVKVSLTFTGTEP